MSLGTKPGEGVSHGICPSCTTKLLQELDDRQEVSVATFRAVFDNSKQGVAGSWRPVRDEPIILDETVDLEESDANYTVVTFETPDDPTSVHEMEYALDGNEEIAEWEITGGNRYVVATQQVSDAAPRQTDAGDSGMAYQTGENIIVYFEPYDNWYGYYFEGVGADGSAFETDDVDGFYKPEDALAAALDEAGA
jgi:hypothetical protein